MGRPRTVGDLTPEQQQRIAPYLGAADGRPDYGPVGSVRDVELCGCTNDALERGGTCGRPECPNVPDRCDATDQYDEHEFIERKE